MVAAGGTDSIGIVVDIDSKVHTNSEAQFDSEVHTNSKAHTAADTDCVGQAQVDRMLALVQPEAAPHSSSSRCRPSFPSRFGMLYNPSLHGLLNYKIYRKGLMGYLQSFASIDTPHHGAL